MTCTTDSQIYVLDDYLECNQDHNMYIFPRMMAGGEKGRPKCPRVGCACRVAT